MPKRVIFDSALKQLREVDHSDVVFVDAQNMIVPVSDGATSSVKEFTTYGINRNVMAFSDTASKHAQIIIQNVTDFIQFGGLKIAPVLFCNDAAPGTVALKVKAAFVADSDDTDSDYGDAKWLYYRLGANDTIYKSDESDVITPSGTLSDDAELVIDIERDTSDVLDDLADPVYIKGVYVYLNQYLLS